MRKLALIVLVVSLGALGIKAIARAYRLQQCDRYAKLVLDMAQERDRGVSSDVLLDRLKAREVAEAAQHKSDPKVRDLIESTIAAIYEHPEITPEQSAVVAHDDCMMLR